MKIKHSDIDFTIVCKVFNLLINNNFNPAEFTQYPNKEVLVAMTAHQEYLLLKIASPLYLEFTVRKNRKVSSSDLSLDEMTTMLNESYSQLSLDSKFRLMPLFFSPDMKTKESIYFGNKEFRDLMYNSFLQLLDKDNLKIQTFKKQYTLEEDLAYLLPLNKYIEDIREDNKEPRSEVLKKVEKLIEKKKEPVIKIKTINKSKKSTSNINYETKTQSKDNQPPWFIFAFFIFFLALALIFNQ